MTFRLYWVGLCLVACARCVPFPPPPVDPPMTWRSSDVAERVSLVVSRCRSSNFIFDFSLVECWTYTMPRNANLYFCYFYKIYLHLKTEYMQILTILLPAVRVYRRSYGLGLAWPNKIQVYINPCSIDLTGPTTCALSLAGWQTWNV